MLSRFVVAFLRRNKCLLISWLQSLSTVMLEPKKNKVCHCFHCFPIYLPWSDGTGCHDLKLSECWVFKPAFLLLEVTPFKPTLPPPKTCACQFLPHDLTYRVCCQAFGLLPETFFVVVPPCHHLFPESAGETRHLSWWVCWSWLGGLTKVYCEKSRDFVPC